MSSPPKPAAIPPAPAASAALPQAEARTALDMLSRATKGAMATLRAADGHPYVSMVLVATAGDLTPVFLISRLALHTQNLLADASSSLLIDETDAFGNVLAGARVTFIGKTVLIEDPAAKAAFLKRHPTAEGYAAFPDFAMYAMTVASAHLIQGFGRIVTIDRATLLGACA